MIGNRAVLSARLDARPAGAHTVTLWRIDDNLVVEQIEIVPLHED